MYKKILSLMLIALLAISSIGACSAQGMNWITADNHKLCFGILNYWTEWCCDQYDYETGERIAHVGYTAKNKWYDLKPKVSNIHFKQKQIRNAMGVVVVPITVGEFTLKNYQYDPLYIHDWQDGDDVFTYYIEYHGFTTKSYTNPQNNLTIDLDKLERGLPYD